MVVMLLLMKNTMMMTSMVSMKRHKSREVFHRCAAGLEVSEVEGFLSLPVHSFSRFCVNPMFCLSYNSLDCIDGFFLILVVVYVYLFFF